MADMDELFGSDGDSDNDQRGNFARNSWLILFNHQFVHLDECRVVRSCVAEGSFNARVRCATFRGCSLYRGRR